MAKFAIKQVQTTYWVVQEKEYTPHENNTITVSLYAYDSEEKAKENNPSDKLEHKKIVINLQGDEKINESMYIDKCCECLGGEKCDLQEGS